MVNNSWGFTQYTGACDDEFRLDIQVLDAVGIATVYSAGNSGPNGNTDLSPANEALVSAVGAVDDTWSVANFSSRGPSACSGGLFPQISAPGVNVQTAGLTYGGIFPTMVSYASGTSLAAPHLAGGLALLMSTDLAVTSAQGDGKLTVLLNDGNGDFSDDQPFTVGWSAWGIASGNLDTDSAIDLLATDGNAASNAMYLYKGNGNGGFSALGSLAAGTFPSAVVTGQFNADTHLDIAVVSGQDGIMIFTGDGDGSFGSGSAVADAASLAFQDLSVALLDNDTTPDLLSPRAAFLGDGNGGFSRSASFGGDLAVASGRFNNDAFSDVVAITASQIQLWLGNGDGTFSFGSIHAPGGTLSDVAAADLDGDQIADVVVCDNANDRVAVLLGTGNGGLAPPQYFATGSEPQAVAIGDWNNDQHPDLAVPFRNFGEIARVSILLQIATPDTAAIFGNGFE